VTSIQRLTGSRVGPAVHKKIPFASFRHIKPH